MRRMFLKNKRLSFKIGLAAAILHLLLFLLAMGLFIYGIATHGSSADGLEMMAFCPFLTLDFFLLPLFRGGPIGKLARILGRLFSKKSVVPFIIIHQTILFGILGTLVWFFIPIFVAKIYKFLKGTPKSVKLSIGCIMIALLGFIFIRFRKNLLWFLFGNLVLFATSVYLSYRFARVLVWLNAIFKKKGEQKNPWLRKAAVRQGLILSGVIITFFIFGIILLSITTEDGELLDKYGDKLLYVFLESVILPLVFLTLIFGYIIYLLITLIRLRHWIVEKLRHKV